MKVTLVKHDEETIVGKAARLSYLGVSGYDSLCEEMTPERCRQLIEKLKKLGHESPFEHVSYTFYIEGISRACSHQLVRHRIASYSQQSQRYIDARDFEYVIPEGVRLNTDMACIYGYYMKKIRELYKTLVDHGIKKEDARYVLPNAVTTNIMVTMNARSLDNFFKLRRAKDSQWEIRELANEMYRLVSEVTPTIFPEEK